MHEHLSIAPAPLLMQEWKYLQSREVLRTTWDVEEMIFLQSLASRAHQGHGSFHGRRFVDTAEDDVARALHLDPTAVRQSRQGLIVAQPPEGDHAVTYQYIRFHEGPGASDDAAIVAGSLLFGGSVSAGVFLADAIDTLEKYVPPEDQSDQDWDLAKEIERDYPG